MRKTGLVLAGLALTLRVAAAMVTELWNPFPAYYLTDAQLMHEAGVVAAEAWGRGEKAPMPGSPSQRVHAAALGALYRVVGPQPLAAKLAHAGAGALGVFVFHQLVYGILGGPPALLAGAALALWPSHVFYTSQNFKDGYVILFLFLAWLAWLPLLDGKGGLRRAAAGLLPAVMLGLLRPGLLYMFCACAAAAAALAAVRRPRQSLWLLVATLAAVPLYSVASRALFAGPLSFEAAPLETEALLRTVSPPDPARDTHIDIRTPDGLAAMRRRRMEHDRLWGYWHGHNIQTQLFPHQEFHSWFDVAAFLPKSAFYVLFMPLPGLYPLDGNIGRILASIENVATLMLACMAVLGLRRSGIGGAKGALLLFFFASTGASALLEFDLGSASRHRLHYFPALLPFAFALRPRRRPERARRLIAQVIECGGPGGTGNQVAAICNALPADEFETTLVYAVREGDPEAYRRRAAGAARAHLVPEFTREIAPVRDLKAFLRLYRLFRDEAPDVVHAHSSKAGALARPAAWLAGVPTIYYSPHGYGFLQSDRGALSRSLYRLLEWSVSWIGTIVAVSPSEAALAAPLSWGGRVETVVDPYLGELPPPVERAEGTLTVGACGRLTAARRPEAFVDLCQRLTDSRNGVRAVWIGGGEREEALRRHLGDLDLSGKVEVTGWLPGEEARERLRRLDILVHYSAWDALPNAVLEAMACGLPVVASDAPGCLDAVVDGETGLIARDPVRLLEHCLRLVDDPALRRRLGVAGRRRVMERFSQTAAMSALSALYRR